MPKTEKRVARKIIVRNKTKPTLPNQHDLISSDAQCEICGIRKPLDRCHILPKSLLIDIKTDPKTKWGKLWERIMNQLLSYSDKNILILCKNHHTLFDRFDLSEHEFSMIHEKVGLMFLFSAHLAAGIEEVGKGRTYYSEKRKQKLIDWVNKFEVYLK